MGSIVVSQASLPYLSETRGHLVLTSSSSYYRGRANTAAYSASKAAVVNLTQALAEEWAAEGVTVSCIVPRRADTPMRRNAFPDEDQGPNLKPEAVADAILELHQRNQTGIVRHVY
ncbi:MAG: SDR family oxidoreductase [Paracoccus sp.]|nr:SDR family oxidoreductase [Paracoccus sp. (in: a-proteobacteria)]